VGAYGATPRIDENLAVHLTAKFNSAFLYKPDGGQAQKQYGKVHLVPFGEYIPFRDTVPLLHKVLLMFTPYDYDYTLDAGREYTVFEMTDFNNPDDKTYRFSVMICYEDAVPKMARRFALDDRGRKQIDWLVNISNDGWFVRFKNDKVIPSTELSQHTAVCVFRAVENRLAILRSVNTGISCLIDSLGGIRDGFVAGNLPAKAMARQGMAGWFADRVPIDKRTTFFSRYGQWLDFCCEGCFIMVIIAELLGRYTAGKGAAKKSGRKDDGNAQYAKEPNTGCR
jgi:apolipoprotein N-acyltransferase